MIVSELMTTDIGKQITVHTNSDMVAGRLFGIKAEAERIYDPRFVGDDDVAPGRVAVVLIFGRATVTCQPDDLVELHS